MAADTIQMPTRRGFNYSLELTEIGGAGGEIGKHITKLRIVDSINSVWTNIAVSAGIDIDEIVKNKMFGQNGFNLKISLCAEEQDEKEVIEIPLIYLQNTNTLIPKKLSGTSDEQQELQPMVFQFLPLEAVNSMTNFVNKVYTFGDDKSGQPEPVTFIKKVLTEVGATFEVDTKGMNTNKIEQIVIPPMSLRQTIDYVNSYFPYYRGPYFFSCNSEGKVKIWDLSQRIKMEPKIIITHLATGNTNPEEYDKTSLAVEDGKHFICSRPIDTTHHFNSNVLSYGYTNVFVTQPNNDLYSLLVGNTDLTGDGFALKDSQSSQFYFLQNLKKLKRYHHNTSGNGYDGSRLSTYISAGVRKGVSINIPLAGNIRMTNLLKCLGEPAELVCQTDEYSQFSGKYIIDSVDIELENTEQQNYACTAKLLLTRTEFNPDASKRTIV